MAKYYILKRNNERLFNDYLCEFEKDKRMVIEKKLDKSATFLLIEKTTIKCKDKSTSEYYTNLWTVEDGAESLVYSKAKNNLVFDYTGFVYPIIHLNKKPMTWEQYNNIKN